VERLIGREAERAQLDDAVAALSRGTGRTVWIEGPAGVGRSALLANAGQSATDVGAMVLAARATESDRQSELGCLSRCLSVTGEAITSPAIVAEVTRLAALRPTVLLLDDIHLADEPSLVTWHLLERATRRVSLLLVATCCPYPWRQRVHQLRHSLAAGGGLAVRLAPLSAREALDLAGQLAGARPGPRLATLVAATGGNPTYLTELIARLRHESRLEYGPDGVEVPAGTVVPAPVLSSVRRQLTSLDPTIRETLAAAALLGDRFEVDELATITALPVTTLTNQLEQAIDAGVVIAGSQDLAFQPALVRDALNDGAPGRQRADRHVAAARALAMAGAPLGRVSRQLILARGDWDEWACGWIARNAGAMVGVAQCEGVDLLRELFDRTPPRDPRWRELGKDLALILFRTGDVDAAEELTHRLLASGLASIDHAELTCGLAMALVRQGRFTEADAAVRAALAAAPEPGWAARLHAIHSSIQLETGDYPAAAEQATHTLALGQGACERTAQASALTTMSRLLLREHRLHDARRLSADALATADGSADAVEVRLSILVDRIALLTSSGMPEEIANAVRDAVAMARRSGRPDFGPLRAALAATNLAAGRWDEAVTVAEHAVSSDDVGVRLECRGLLAMIAVYRDHPEQAEAALSAVDDIDAARGTLRYRARFRMLARSLLAEWHGRLDVALEALQPSLEPEYVADVLHRHMWLGHVADLALRCGDESTARAAVAACDHDAAAIGALASVPVARASAHAVLDRDPAALADAACAYDRLGLRTHAPWARHLAALMYAENADRDAARTTWREAVAGYHANGAAWAVRIGDAQLARHGVRRTGGRTTRRAATGWAALTPSEQAVARLVADGHSNRDISDRLVLSPRTVETHMSRIMTKLDARSRVDIARRASAGDLPAGATGESQAGPAPLRTELPWA
jgi:DNA-binding CsgD family transcriptional regulator